MAKGETWKRWADDNIVRVCMNLNRTNDADIIAALEAAGEPKGTVIKRLIREALELDKNGK